MIATATNRLQTAETTDQRRKEQATNRSIDMAPKTSILGLEWVDPFFSARHWVPEQIEAIGAISAIGSPTEHSRTLSAKKSWTQIRMSSSYSVADLVLQDNLKFAKKLYSIDSIKSLRAVQNNQVWAIDANSFCSRPTIRVVDGSVHMARTPTWRHSRYITLQIKSINPNTPNIQCTKQ